MEEAFPGGRPIEEITAKWPYMKELFDFLPALYGESDRGMALIATSLLDELLGKAISAFLVDCKATQKLLVGFNAPLGSLSSRIAAASALGLISEDEADEAHRLRRVRNAFAHGVHVSFGDATIANICRQLKCAEVDYGELDKNERVRNGSRNDFALSATQLINRLLIRFAKATQRLRKMSP